MTKKTDNKFVVQQPFSKGYWDRPSPKEFGSDSADAIYLAVGRALSQWETAENSLAFLFIVLSECENPQSFDAIRRAFGSIESSAGRRAAIEATAEIYFGKAWSSPVVNKPFKALMAAYEEGSKRRDEIAHGIANHFNANGVDHGGFLCPADYNTRRTHAFMGDPADPLSFKRSKYRYTADDITNIAKKFSDLWNKTIGFAEKIRKIDGQPALAWLATIDGDDAKAQFFEIHGIKIEEFVAW